MKLTSPSRFGWVGSISRIRLCDGTVAAFKSIIVIHKTSNSFPNLSIRKIQSNGFSFVEHVENGVYIVILHIFDLPEMVDSGAHLFHRFGLGFNLPPRLSQFVQTLIFLSLLLEQKGEFVVAVVEELVVEGQVVEFLLALVALASEAGVVLAEEGDLVDQGV
jgi:hypothetical protein